MMAGSWGASQLILTLQDEVVVHCLTTPHKQCVTCHCQVGPVSALTPLHTYILQIACRQQTRGAEWFSQGTQCQQPTSLHPTAAVEAGLGTWASTSTTSARSWQGTSAAVMVASPAAGAARVAAAPAAAAATVAVLVARLLAGSALQCDLNSLCRQQQNQSVFQQAVQWSASCGCTSSGTNKQKA